MFRNSRSGGGHIKRSCQESGHQFLSNGNAARRIRPVQHPGVFTGLRTNVKRPATSYPSCWPLTSYGAEGETRTPTLIRALDPEPSVSTNSTTSAIKRGQFIAKGKCHCKGKTEAGDWGLGAGKTLQKQEYVILTTLQAQPSHYGRNRR